MQLFEGCDVRLRRHHGTHCTYQHATQYASQLKIVLLNLLNEEKEVEPTTPPWQARVVHVNLGFQGFPVGFRCFLLFGEISQIGAAASPLLRAVVPRCPAPHW